MENGKEGASGFYAAMVQAAEIRDGTRHSSSPASGAGENGGPRITAAASAAVIPAEESSEAACNPTEGSELPSDHRSDSRIAHRSESLTKIERDVVPEDGRNMDGGVHRPSAGREDRNIRKLGSEMPSSWTKQARSDDGSSMVSDVDSDMSSDIPIHVRWDHRRHHGGEGKRPDDRGTEGMSDISAADPAAASLKTADELSGGVAMRTSSPDDIPDLVASHARLTLKGGAPEIEITLRPESLGHLRIQVSSDHRRVSVRILAENTTAAAVMKDHAARLATALHAAGFEMAHFEVFVERPKEHLDAVSGPSGSAGGEGDFPSAGFPTDSPGAEKSPMPAAAGLPTVDHIDFFA